MKPILEVKNISKKFIIDHEQQAYLSLRDKIQSVFSPKRTTEDFWALKDVNFQVERGETIGIIGKNGAGKSTLLKIFSKITPPTSGSIITRGRIASLLEVGTGFHPELSGRENIYLNGSILGMRKKEIDLKFDEIVDFSGVEKFLDTPLKRYSSGMQLRLAFAVAAFLEPEILIIDEVLAVGDAEFQRKCMGQMEEVSRSGRTILFVSHNMAAVSQLCKKTVWLHDGEVKLIGNTFEVVPAYISRITHHDYQKNWTLSNAPGDDEIKLLSCKLVQNNRTIGVIDINQSCEVEIVFSVLKPVKNLICGSSIYTLEGNCITANADWKPNVYEPGIYKRSMLIPARILAEGDFSILVQLVFYDPSKRSVYLPDILTFHAHDSDHPDTVRGLYKEAWPGVVRIGFEWTEPRSIDPNLSAS